VVLIPQVRFGYRAAGGHIAVETAAVMIALLVALLALGRFRRGDELGDLLLTATFLLLALPNLVFTTIPAVVSARPNDSTTWGAVGGRMVVPGSWRPGPSRRRTACRYVMVHGGSQGASAGACWSRAGLAVAATWLPEPVDPELSPTVGMPGLDGPVLLLAPQLAAALFYGVAAVGYLRRTAVVADPLYGGLGVGSVLAACSATNYALFTYQIAAVPGSGR
jgi:hypothetical protein